MTVETLWARLDAMETRPAIESLMDGDLLRSLWHDDATLNLPEL